MWTVFFDCSAVVHHEFLAQGCTVNKEYYLEVMCGLREAIRELCKNQSRILHHDNPPAHTSTLGREFLAKNKIVIMPQPLYSPDLAAADFFLFPELKTPRKWKGFATIKEIKANRNYASTIIFTGLGCRWLFPLPRTEDTKERKRFCYD